MLNLHAPTAPDWSERIRLDVPTLLVDHAHCEKKAASTAIQLIFTHQDRQEMMAPLSELAREELRHFEQCLRLLERRGIPFIRLRPSPYAATLRKACRKEEPAKTVDVLLVCALIEARSCERMKILSETLEDRELAGFYGELLASEARHHTTYIDMASAFEDRAVVMARLAELAIVESEVLFATPDEARMHSAGPRTQP
jgi:tRNA-(ms[2]io[6]A)-hydroxylase